MEAALADVCGKAPASEVLRSQVCSVLGGALDDGSLEAALVKVKAAQEEARRRNLVTETLLAAMADGSLETALFECRRTAGERKDSTQSATCQSLIMDLHDGSLE